MILGPVGAVNAIPQDKPTFTVRIPGGASYTVHAQPISEIFAEDGSQLLPHEFRSGLRIKATVEFNSNVAGGTPGFVTDNLVILLEE